MKHLIFVVLSYLLLSSIQFAQAADVAVGKKKAALCASCHGVSGIATLPMYPNLAGQNEAYLISALNAYRDKQRNGGMAAIMQMQAAKLSDSDIENIAAYYSSLK